MLEPKHKLSDTHLRSMQAVTGYRIQASDGAICHVCNFRMDHQSWVIRQLVVKTGHRFTGKEVQVPVGQVGRISYDESTVFVNSTRAAIEQGPAHQLTAFGAADPVKNIL